MMNTRKKDVRLSEQEMSSNAVLDDVLKGVGEIILGKDQVVLLGLTCLIANGHLLIEDQPGLGKTTLAHALAKVFGLLFQRIQFTSDLLPSDILGTSVYNKTTGDLDFRPGPIFSQFILADEINRATPRTQSALLEAMGEYQVSIEGQTRALPSPFFVVATQNPSDQIGTFPLPESQLDRFLMSLMLGYPDLASERELLQGQDRRVLLAKMEPIANLEYILLWQKQASVLHISDPLLDYVQKLLETSRHSSDFHHGLSPRAGLDLLRCARAWAFLEQRQFVVPEDIQVVLPYVVAHRLSDPNHQNLSSGMELAHHLIDQVSIP